MKTGKKFWCILLALVMLLGMAAPVAYAETEETPEAVTVENITAEPVTFLEGVYSYTITGEEGEEIGVYNPMEVGFTVVIHYSDGSTAECYSYDLYNMFNTVENITDIQDTSAWTVGDNVFQMQVDEFTLDVPVIIKENPVASVTVDPVTAYMGIHQREGEYYDEELQDFVQGKVFDVWNLNYRFNVTFTDGTTKTLSKSELWDYELDFSTMISDSATASWTAGNTYELPMKVSGIKCVTEVTVLANPVAAVRVPDIQIKKSEAYDGQYYFGEKMRIELTDTDGKVHSMKLYELYDMEVYPDFRDPQYEGVVFEPGETYTIPYEVLGYEGEFKVEIIDDGIDTITAEAQYPLYEALSSNVHNLYSADPIITVTRKDGTSITFPYSEYGQYINTEVWFELVDAPEGEYLPAGEHEVAVFIEDAVGTFTLNVLENPVESFTVTTKYPFVYNADGFYNYEAVPYSVTLELKDGTAKTYTNPFELWEDYRTYDAVPYLITDPEAPLTAGTHAVDAVLMGMCCKQTVTIADSGITKVTGSYDGVLIENISGWMSGDVDENGEWIEYFHYMLNSDLLRITVTYADGSQQTLDLYDSFMGSTVGGLLNTEENQSGTNPWKLGKNKLSCSMLGHSFEIEVEVVENTIKDIAVKATKPLYQGWHVVEVFENEVYLDTRQAGLEITVTYADGTAKTYTYEAFANEFNQVGVSPVEGSTVGTKTTHLWFGNDTIDFKVEVKENPVKSVTIAPSKSLTENKEKLYDIKETVPVYTVTYTDGTTETFYGNAQLIEKFDIYPSWSDPEEFVVGENTVDVTVFGHTVKYTFEIVKAVNPLTKITAKAVAPLYMSDDPYYDYYEYASLVEVTLTYADGSTETVMANELRSAEGTTQIYFFDNQQSVQWGVGKHQVTAYYMGFETEFAVEVVENPYTKLTISAENGLTVTLEKKDGTKEVMIAKRYQVDDAAKIGTAGNLITDKGSMFVVFYFSGENQENIAYMEYNGMKSNALEGCKWLSQQMAMQGTGNVSVDKTAQELIDLVDKNAYRVWLTVSELSQSSISSADAAKIQAAIPSGYKAAVTLDLNLYKESDYGIFQISQVAEKIGITVAAPSDLGALLAGLKVIRLHNGVADVLDAAYNAQSNTITFQTDRFSTYTVVYSAHELTKVDAKAATTEATGLKEHYKCSVCGKLFADAEGKTETTEAEVTIAKLTPDTDAKPDTGSNPDTGDETPLVVLFVLMSTSALLAAGTVLARKKFH